MNKYFLFLSILIASLPGRSQLNIISTNSDAEAVLQGNYDPAAYAATNVIDFPDTISARINRLINPDSMKLSLEILSSYHTRNSGSDTVSNNIGIGAARRWVYSKFEEFSNQNESRLIPSYLQFDLLICGAAQHRNIFAVLPGRDTSDPSIIIIEAHLDSRC